MTRGRRPPRAAPTRDSAAQAQTPESRAPAQIVHPPSGMDGGADIMANKIDVTECARAMLDVAGELAISERLVAQGVPAEGAALARGELLVKAGGLRSEGEVAALAINLTGGRIAPKDLTRILAASFPTLRVGDRHGPHYISLARTGKLKGVDDAARAIKFAPRRARAPALVAPAAPVPSEGSVREALAPTPAAGEDVALVAPILRPPADTREQLEALSPDDLLALAKAAGVKARGKRTEIIERVLAARGGA